MLKAISKLNINGASKIHQKEKTNSTHGNKILFSLPN